MSTSDLNRRDFHKLTMAAFGGVLAGSVTGCNKKTEAVKTDEKPKGDLAKTEEVAVKTDPDAHLCRGLNTCKGKGQGANNECAGQGACATFAAHECAGENACKGQGGCGENPGKNDCKGKGHCHVPLMKHAWEKVRKSLEEQLKESGKTIGPAPNA